MIEDVIGSLVCRGVWIAGSDAALKTGLGSNHTGKCMVWGFTLGFGLQVATVTFRV